MCNCTSGNLEVLRCAIAHRSSCGACHRAAPCADPLARPGTTVCKECNPMTPSEIEKLFRDEAGRALATLIRLVGDFDLAQDALQDAFAVALGRWPQEDPPSHPRARPGHVGR